MKNKVIIIAAAIVLLALLAGGGYYIWRQQQTIDELTEGFALEKEQLEDEYTQLAIQYEGYKLQVNNDSLEQKLEDQRIKIQRLVEELRQTKAQDARRIAALKKELETVRGVLRYYVAQVDSLNKVNDALVAENQQIRSDMRTVQQQNQQVRQQNETLTKQVTVAAQLSATNVSVTALDRKDKVEKRNRVDKLAKFQVNFTIDRREGRLSAHPASQRRGAHQRAERKVQVRERQTRLLRPQDHRVRRRRDARHHVLQAWRSPRCRHLSCRDLCRWQHDRSRLHRT